MKFLKIWTDFREIMSPLGDAEKGRLFEAMLLYAETGEEPKEFEGNERFLWPAAKQSIDRTNDRNETLRRNGQKGGRPRTKDNQEKPNCPAENQEEPKESCKEKKENKKKKNEKETLLTECKEKRFTPPLVSEVTAYCRERNNRVDPEKFVDFYTAKGWRVGREPMRDWRAAVRTWEKEDARAVRKVLPAQDFGQRDYSGVNDVMMDELAEEMREFKEREKAKARDQRRLSLSACRALEYSQ